jgi:hypothetical protein
MVEAKDLILIGAVGAAGILGFKAIKGGLSGIIPSINITPDTPLVDYEKSAEYLQLLKDDTAQLADVLKSLKSAAQTSGSGGTLPSSGSGGTLPSSGSGGDDNGGSEDVPEYSTKDLAGLADAATFAIERAGGYGSLRKAASYTAEGTDKTEQSLGKIGLESGEYLLTKKLGEAVGLSPSLTGTLGAVASVYNPTNLMVQSPSSITSESNIFVGIADWLGLR